VFSCSEDAVTECNRLITTTISSMLLSVTEMRPDKLRLTPMTCPECLRAVGFHDLRVGRCSACGTRICVPRSYYRPIQISSVVVTILLIVVTFSTFFTSPASFPLVMLWFLLMLVFFCCSLGIGAFVFYRIFPPYLDRLYSNDRVTVLRLDE
jgi:hypothetical protein